MMDQLFRGRFAIESQRQQIIYSARGRSFLPGFGLLVLFLCAVQSAQGQLHVGPVYSNSDPKSDAAFPRIRVVISAPAPQQMALQPADLTLTEDGAAGGHAREIRSFESTGYPLAAAVAIDVSGSMAGKPIKIVRDSLYKFVSDARPKDKVGVLTIADDAIWDVPFDADRATLKGRLQNISNRGKLTRLYDGLLTAIGTFDPSLPARRELTVISDGHDEGSKSRLQDVIEMARARGIAVDTVGLTRSSPIYLQTLMSLAAETGGVFRQVHSDQELQALIENGIVSLKATPVATFEVLHIPPDGKRHRIGIRLKSVPASASEVSFQAPDHAAKPIRYFIDHLPNWAYAVLASVCVGLIALVVVVFRRFGKGVKPIPDQAYYYPPPTSAFPAETAKSHAAITPPLGSLTSEAAEANRGSESGPLYSSGVAPSAQNASKKTQLAGIFQKSGQSIAKLEVVAGAMFGQSFDVPGGNFWIGAAKNNDLEIPDDATVSSRHACLLFEDPILILVDNESTNGTRVNGEMLRGVRRPLRSGDQIQIGRTLFRVISKAEGI